MKIASLEKPLVIFIYGVPGTRKSSTAIKLAEKLGIKVVVGTDQIRDAIKLYIDDPFLKRPTHNCWQLLGDRTPENIAKGYLKQSGLIKEAVLSMLELARKRGENMIFEGVHLFPKMYSQLENDPNLIFFSFLLRAENEILHRHNIALKISLRHNKEKNWPEEKIEDIREIQKFLLGKRILHSHLINSTTPENNAKAILEILERGLLLLEVLEE